MRYLHTLEPIFDENSKILILGSFPSIVSRKNMMYYSHPQNRFWKVMAIIFNEEILDKKEFILRHNLALWDTIESCEINGSSDSSIKNVVPVNIDKILKVADIKYIITVGKKSYELYKRYLYDKTKINPIVLPSTSPANASKRLDDLVKDFSIILDL